MISRRPRIWRLLALFVAVLALSAVLASPADAAPVAPPPAVASPAPPDPNPVETLDGGSLSHSFPLDNYGLDQNVELNTAQAAGQALNPLGTVLGDIFGAGGGGGGDIFSTVGQWFIQIIWQVALYLLNAVMVMMQWAFAPDLLEKAMEKLPGFLQVLQNNIITPWGLSAIIAMALWGIWTGLVRNKTIDTFRGLAASLSCMAALLVLIGNPTGTLGTAVNVANGASTEMLSAISRGTVDDPQEGVTTIERRLFETIALRPWCALQFGDVQYCLSEPKGLKQTVADTWLQDAPDSPWRQSLFKITHSKSRQESEQYGSEPPGKDRDLGDMFSLAGHPEKVALMGGGLVASRFALLMLIVIGLIGAMALFSYLSVRLLLAALSVLILAMFAPAMFLVAALGESGRASIVAWFTRLVGAVVTKVIYALFLAVIIATSTLVTELELGFYPTWIIFIAFWWGVLLKRHDLLALLSLDPKAATPSGLDFDGSASGNALSQLFYAKQLAGDVRRGVRRVTSGPRAVLRAGGDRLRREREAARMGESDAARQLAREELERDGRLALERRNAEEHRAEVEQAAPILAREQKLNQRLADIDNQIGLQRSRGKSPHQAGDPFIRRLQEERGKVEKELIDLRADPEFARARSVSGSKPSEVRHADVQAWIAGRPTELGRDRDADENLQAAGIDPAQHRSADGATQDANLARAGATMARHNELLDRAGIGYNGDERESMSYLERRRARSEARQSGNFDHFRDIAQRRAARNRQRSRNERRGRRRVR